MSRTPRFRALRRAGVWIAAGLIGAGLLMWQQQRLNQRIADDRLDSAHAIQGLIEQQAIADLRTRAELIAGNQAFIGYLTQAAGGILSGAATDDASIIDLVEERRTQLGLAIAAVVDERGQLLASPDSAAALSGFTAQPLFKQAVAGGAPGHGLWLKDERIFYVMLLPLTPYGADAGFLLVGEPIDTGMAKRLSAATHTQIALFATATRTMLAASSPSDTEPDGDLLKALRADRDGGEHRYNVRVNAVGYRGYLAPLFGSGSVRVAALVDTRMSWATRLELGAPMLIALLVFFVAAMLTRANSPAAIEQEIGDLARIMERAAEVGDFNLQAPEVEGRIVAPLAIAFNRLMARLRGTRSG